MSAIPDDLLNVDAVLAAIKSVTNTAALWHDLYVKIKNWNSTSRGNTENEFAASAEYLRRLNTEVFPLDQVALLLHLITTYSKPGDPAVQKYLHEMIEPLNAPQDKSVDKRAWGIFFLAQAGEKVPMPSNPPSPTDHIFFRALEDSEAKIRQWGVYALGAIADPSGNKNSSSYESNLVNNAAKDRMIDCWKKEYDIYVARQLMISLGNVSGFDIQHNRDELIDLLRTAINHPTRLIREHTADTINGIVRSYFSPTISPPMTDKDVTFFCDILSLTDNFLKQSLPYDEYRNGINVITKFTTKTLQQLAVISPDLINTCLQQLFKFVNINNLSMSASDQTEEDPVNVQTRALHGIRVIGLALRAYAAKYPAQTDLVNKIITDQIETPAKILFEQKGPQLANDLTVELAKTLSGVLGIEPASGYFTGIILTTVNLNDPLWERSVMAIGTLGKDAQLQPLLAAYTPSKPDPAALSAQTAEDISKIAAQAENARRALEKIGGSSATQALTTQQAKTLVQEQLLSPIQEVHKAAFKILEETSTRAAEATKTSKYVTWGVIGFGFFILIVSLIRLYTAPGDQQGVIVTTLFGGITTLVGLYAQLFYDPIKKYNEGIAQMTRLLTATQGYVSLSGVVGIAVQDAYSKGTFDANFLRNVSEISNNLMQNTAGIFADNFVAGTVATVLVPDLTGKTWAKAKSDAQERGLDIALDDTEPLVDDATIEGGLIAKQSPLVNYKTNTGTLISVKLSKKAAAGG